MNEIDPWLVIGSHLVKALNEAETAHEEMKRFEVGEHISDNFKPVVNSIRRFHELAVEKVAENL